MKKLFSILAMVFFAATTLFAVPTPGESFTDNGYTGPWNPDMDFNLKNKVENDYSFDMANGEYKIFVICEIDVTNITGNIYLGWLNPDGAKDLGPTYNMQFKVTGGNGWPFEANAYFGADGSNADVAFAKDEQHGDAFTNNVFITGSVWHYAPAGGSPTTITGQVWNDQHFVLSGVMGQFDGFVNGPKIGDTYGGGHGVLPSTTPKWQDNAKVKSFWDKCEGCCPSNACKGEGMFVLTPGTIWASPDAEEGFYTFPVYIEVDYLTFKNAPNYYYPAGGNHPDPSNFHLQP